MPSLYLHIPFCIRRCLYCDFYVEALGSGPLSARLRDFRQRQHQAFLRALDLELAGLPRDFAPETVYLGGGTPTELPPSDLAAVFTSLRTHVNLSSVREFSCEANPGTLDGEMAALLIREGVDRISLGVQSFDDPTLELLGRIHDAAGAEHSFRQLRQAGAANLSLDLLFGLPRTPMDVTRRNLEWVARLNPEHVSWYSLEYEKDTALTRMRDQGFVKEADEEQVETEYRLIREGLCSLGYEHYELFSFAKPGRACLHNRNYWQHGDYRGCGPSAHSFVGGVRSANRADLGHYIRQLTSGASPQDRSERLEGEAAAREAMFIGLRQTAGLQDAVFQARYGVSLHQLLGGAERVWRDQGWIAWEDGTLRLLPEAYLISDTLFRELVSP